MWTQGFSTTSPGRGYYGGGGVGQGKGGLYGDVPIERGAPPSSYAIAAFINGEPGSTSRLVGTTVLRSVFIVPGVWLGTKLFARDADLSLIQMTGMGLAASTTITGGLLFWYWLKARSARGENFNGG